MPNQIYFIYDDRVMMPDSISSIVGRRNFGDILYKKITLFEYIKTNLERANIYQIIRITSDEQIKDLCERLKQSGNKITIIHYMANHVVIDVDEFVLSIQKLVYSQKTSVNNVVNPSMLAFTRMSEYERYLALAIEKVSLTITDVSSDYIVFTPNTFLLNISEVGRFLSFFSGGFEARFFNQLYGDKFTLVKQSTDKAKMKKEHDYYHLVPDSMKRWFVMPYDFKETDLHASYSMERLNVPDMALQWIHNSVSLEQFKAFLERIFNFIKERPALPVTKEEYMVQFKSLYFDKVMERFHKLKTLKEYPMLSGYIQTGLGMSLDQIYEDYQTLFHRMGDSVDLNQKVIGHGDLCFSNILYDKSSYLMKFIDTKGATVQEELWTDPYYDIAKLSHSVLGNYDYINNNLFEIVLDDTCSLKLKTGANDRLEYRKYFAEVLEQYNININHVRMCELSLFLSMLPLHIDYPKKVLAFILNAIEIKKEIE